MERKLWMGVENTESWFQGTEKTDDSCTLYATGICWTEIRLAATCKVTLAVRDVCVPKAFHSDLPIDQKLAVLRKLFLSCVAFDIFSLRKIADTFISRLWLNLGPVTKYFMFFPGHYLP